MASIAWQGFTSWVGNIVTAVQSSAKAAVDASVGSVTLAWAQGVAGVALWLQALIIQVLLLTRAATSQGSDLDSFYADFDFYRLKATQGTTNVTVARFTPQAQAVVPIGALFSTGPGGLQFQVALDTTNANYNAGLNGYVAASNVASITVPVQAVTAGTAGGNVQANTITSFVQPIVGFDTVTNAAAVTNALDVETDQAFRARFPLYLAGLQGADDAAIQSAIQGVQQGIYYAIIENYDWPGTTVDNGNFFVIIDDGTGSPPSTLLNAVTAAIAAVKAKGIRFQVYGPTVVTPSVVLNVRVATGYVAGSVQEAVNAAVVTATNAVVLPNGDVNPSSYENNYYISLIEGAALAVPGVVSVQPGQTKINGTNADYALNAVQEVRITSENVTVGSY